MKIQKYKSLFDKCLYIDLPEKNNNNNRQLQIRDCDSTTHFSVIYTDGYKAKVCGFAHGYDELKLKIRSMYNEYK